ncbi:MAG: bifunctional histidinol-phosphatase/imidazoleglycerol-phosphate dehydratase HisB [Pedobacter sp.]|nr:MAG: bifunctional histidinol-phosphatase/imidazoleglycerol-phosphate dehydratase HisB [Pedobacter sp.]
MKKVLFIDRDGTLIKEPADEQIDSFEKLIFYPEVFHYLGKIAKEMDYELVMVSNQDGLGTSAYPEANFIAIQDFIIKSLANEGIQFSAIHIDRSFAQENLPTRKPQTGMLTSYFSNTYDLTNSFVIGDRLNDVLLAKNLGSKCIYLNQNPTLGASEGMPGTKQLTEVIALETLSWKDIYLFLLKQSRNITHSRKTLETQIDISLGLEGSGISEVQTGLNFFDHMLDQLARHGLINLKLEAKGDLHIDEHHTIEDTGIALGEAFNKALGNKLGIERYGYCLPMDDCLAQVAIDFGGRNWLVWEAEFKREKIGDMPCEMFYHFFKSFSDAAKCNLFIKADGYNEHHKIEAIFKAFAKAIKMAIKQDPQHLVLPSTKGTL